MIIAKPITTGPSIIENISSALSIFNLNFRYNPKGMDRTSKHRAIIKDLISIAPTNQQVGMQFGNYLTEALPNLNHHYTPCTHRSSGDSMLN